MKTRYPIEYKKGKLVKYLKPYKYITYEDVYTREILCGNSLSDLVDWVEEKGGLPEDAIIDYDYDYDLSLRLTIQKSEEDIAKQEKEYAKLLKEWEEWRDLSKTAKNTEEYKNQQTKIKALKTQEKNLLAKLRKVQEEQEKLK